MRKLTVENFSVIKEAQLEFGKITVLIGPQSSGKSVLCKLAFFSLEAINIASTMLFDLRTFAEFQSAVKEDFKAYFPIQTWGSKEFRIVYEQGEFKTSIVRRIRAKKPSELTNITFSTAFKAAYEDTLAFLKSDPEKESDRAMRYFTSSDKFRRSIESLLGEGGSATQTFIPAGRSFFTSFGKAIVAFEESGSLDPLTLRYGRQMRWDNTERLPFAIRGRRSSEASEILQTLERESSLLLGGTIKYEREKPFFASKDGRKLPLSWLSSGQQELLPLLTTLKQRVSYAADQTMYIEEPEAHIFPEAQKQLVSLLAWIAHHPSMKTSMVLTTHSPYLLSAFNNLIEAGQLANRFPRLVKEIGKIVPERFWIKDGTFAAFCIHDGVLKPILSDSGLIDGEYLDSVSDSIGNEFDALLRLEYDHTEAS